MFATTRARQRRELKAAGGTPRDYERAHKCGAAHAQCLEILAAGGTLTGYGLALEEGASHAQCLEILAAGDTLFFYGVACRSGATHAECLEVLRAGGILRRHNWAISKGATHTEAVALSTVEWGSDRDFRLARKAYRLLSRSERQTRAVVDALVRLAETWPRGPEDLAAVALACAADPGLSRSSGHVVPGDHGACRAVVRQTSAS